MALLVTLASLLSSIPYAYGPVVGLLYSVQYKGLFGAPDVGQMLDV
jgi:hypothetical protein